MNINLLNAVKQIIAQNGAEILDNPKRTRAFLDDFAAKEPKAERNTLINCLQYGFYVKLQKTTAEERPLLKNHLARWLYDEHGTEPALSRAALDLLEATLSDEESEVSGAAVDFSTNGDDWESVGEQTAAPQSVTPRAGFTQQTTVYYLGINMQEWGW
jgi:hypothetical protein